MSRRCQACNRLFPEGTENEVMLVRLGGRLLHLCSGCQQHYPPCARCGHHGAKARLSSRRLCLGCEKQLKSAMGLAAHWQDPRS